MPLGVLSIPQFCQIGKTGGAALLTKHHSGLVKGGWGGRATALFFIFYFYFFSYPLTQSHTYRNPIIMAQKVLYETNRQTEFDWTTKAVLPPTPRQFFTIPASNTAGKAWEEGEYYYMVYTRALGEFLGYAAVENPTPNQIHNTIQGALN